MMKKKSRPDRKHKLPAEVVSPSSLYQSDPNFNLPTFSFKEEGTSSDTKQIWNLLSNQILTPFAPKYKIYNYQKFLPNQKNLNIISPLDTSRCLSPKHMSSKVKLLKYLSVMRPRDGDETIESTARQRSVKKGSVRFDLRITSPREREVSSFLRQPELLTEGDKGNTSTQKGSAKIRYLSFRDLELPNASIEKSVVVQRKNSMFEYPVERLLDDVDGNATYIKPAGDDRSEKDTLSTSNYRPKSLISDIDSSITRRSRRKEAPPVVQQEKKIDYNQIYPIRRRSCTCRDCGVNKKLIKSNTIFLTEDFEILRKNLRKTEFKSKKPNLITIFGGRFRQKTNVSGVSDQPVLRNFAKKMLQVLQITSVLRRFTKRPAPNPIGNNLEEASVYPSNIPSMLSLKASQNVSSGKELLSKLDNSTIESDKFTSQSQRNQEGNPIVSGIGTNNNESCFNTSRLVSPLAAHKQNKIVFIAQHNEDNLSPQQKSYANPISLNELREDFDQANNQQQNEDPQTTLVLDSVNRLCEAPNNVLDPEVSTGIFKSSNSRLRELLQSPDNCLHNSRENTRMDTTNEDTRDVLTAKKINLNNQSSFMISPKTKAKVQYDEFERQVREVILKTRKHIGLKPIMDENSALLSPKSHKFSSIEDRMTKTYYQKSALLASKGQSKGRDHNPLKIRLGSGTESITSLSRGNYSRGKLVTEAASLARLDNFSTKLNNTQTTVARSFYLKPRTQLNLSQNTLNSVRK